MGYGGGYGDSDYGDTITVTVHGIPEIPGTAYLIPGPCG